MLEYTDSFFYKLRVVAVCALILISLLLLPVFISLLWSHPHVQAASPSASATSDAGLEESPNIITSGFFSAIDDLGENTNKTEKNVNNFFNDASHSISAATIQSGKFVASGIGLGANAIAFGVGGTINFTANVVSGTFNFAVSTTGKVFGLIGSAPPVSSIITPEDNTPIPVIEDGNMTVAKAKSKAATKKTAVKPKTTAVNNSKAMWPIHGIITTYFGEPHWPYQPTHTGIDISDGKPAGVTRIKPYKPGKVIDTIYSNVGLGNHIIVDHGHGITSVYGHLNSISVEIGEQVTQNTTLGFEGSTGASTGTHLHFEIRKNGQPVNPFNYVDGRP